MALIALRFDFRNQDDGPATTADLYSACLEMCEWGDSVGADYAALSEHHGTDDGFLPAPLTMAGLILGRTRRLRVSIACMLAPLNDPVRTAEQMAVLDLAGRGRLSVVLGAGYRQEEFDMYGVDRSARGRLLEEFVETLRKAWTGEPFEWRGRTVRVTPKPRSRPHPLVFVGGSAPVSARRAARLRIGFFPAVNDPELAAIYREECEKVGFRGSVYLPNRPGFVHVSRDPERDWARLAPFILHDSRTYADWQTPEIRSEVAVFEDDLDGIKSSGVYKIVTPEECLELAEEVGQFGSITLHPLLAGMPPELGWESLELFATEVLPELKGRAVSPPAGPSRSSSS